MHQTITLDQKICPHAGNSARPMEIRMMCFQGRREFVREHAAVGHIDHCRRSSASPNSGNCSQRFRRQATGYGANLWSRHAAAMCAVTPCHWLSAGCSS